MYKFLPPQPPEALVLNVMGNVTFILDGANAHLRITSTGSGPNTWTVQTYFRLFPKF